MSDEIRWPGGRNVTCQDCERRYTVEKLPKWCPYCKFPASIDDVEGIVQETQGDRN